MCCFKDYKNFERLNNVVQVAMNLAIKFIHTLPQVCVHHTHTHTHTQPSSSSIRSRRYACTTHTHTHTQSSSSSTRSRRYACTTHTHTQPSNSSTRCRRYACTTHTHTHSHQVHPYAAPGMRAPHTHTHTHTQPSNSSTRSRRYACTTHTHSHQVQSQAPAGMRAHTHTVLQVCVHTHPHAPTGMRELTRSRGSTVTDTRCRRYTSTYTRASHTVTALEHRNTHCKAFLFHRTASRRAAAVSSSSSRRGRQAHRRRVRNRRLRARTR